MPRIMRLRRGRIVCKTNVADEPCGHGYNDGRASFDMVRFKVTLYVRVV